MLTEELFIWLIRKQLAKPISDKKEICYCFDDSQYDCLLDEIHSVCPGQIVQFDLLQLDISIVGELVIANNALPTSCRVVQSSEISLIYNNCTSVQYIVHDSSC